MTPLEFILLLTLAGVLGVAAQRILGSRYGLLVSIILGFTGAWLGKQLHVWFHLPIIFYVGIGDERFPVLWAVVGAVIVTFAAGLIAGSRRKPEKKK
jgi:uncharacterized membrane protein YeaQ/YmgE (transglycosylase-associated protein family)